MASTSIERSPVERRASITRRQFLIGGSAAIVVVGCGAPSDSDDAGTASDARTRRDGLVNAAPVWETIPDQSWVVGVPVHFDLREYCSDADVDELTFSLEGVLPAGLMLVGSVIMGTPTEVTAGVSMTATADDGQG
jgi:hypothetical protein